MNIIIRFVDKSSVKVLFLKISEDLRGRTIHWTLRCGLTGRTSVVVVYQTRLLLKSIQLMMEKDQIG